MIPFCCFDNCLLDANGRIKLSPKVLADFQAYGPDPVLHCLPEGAIGVYPEETFRAMRGTGAHTPERAGESFAARRVMRRFGAMSQSCEISSQGRLTIPVSFREHAGLRAGDAIVVAGVEIGVEIWSAGRWQEEQKKIRQHMDALDEAEMNAELEKLHDNKENIQ